jgi:hypothetical protein
MLNTFRNTLPEILPELLIAGVALFFPLVALLSIIGP